MGGMEKHNAMEYFAKLHMEPHLFHQAWGAADLGHDGRLDRREFCLFVQLLRGAQKGLPLPAALAPEEAAALLGEAPMPPAMAAVGSSAQQQRAGRAHALRQGQHGSHTPSLGGPEDSLLQVGPMAAFDWQRRGVYSSCVSACGAEGGQVAIPACMRACRGDAVQLLSGC